MSQLPHLLVVDDDREIRDLLKRFLAKHGFRVTLAEDGRACLSAIEDGRFDLVVLDVMMPGEDGLSVCRRIRATSSLPVIMLTAMGEETDRIIGLEIGADDYLPKPFNPRELLARVRAILRRAEPLQEAPATGDSFAFFWPVCGRSCAGRNHCRRRLPQVTALPLKAGVLIPAHGHSRTRTAPPWS